MSGLHYGKCKKCNYMGGLNDNLVCLDCVDEKRLLSKKTKKTIKELTELVQLMGGVVGFYGDINNCDTLPKYGKIYLYDDVEKRDIGLPVPIVIIGKRAREIQSNDLFKKYYGEVSG